MIQAIVDIEKVVSDHLRDETGERIVGKPPSSTAESWVMVTQLAAQQNDPADHLTEFYLQLDCYAGKDGGQPEANLLGRTIRQALLNGLRGVHDDAVVSEVRINGDARIPDYEMEPARDRRVLTVDIWAHAT